MATVKTCVRCFHFLLLFIVSNSSSRGESESFNGTITTGDTVVLSQAGTYNIASTQVGSYGGGSFALGNMVYDVNTSLNSSKSENSGFTAVSFMTVSDQSANTHSGAITNDNSSDASTDCFTRQDTITSNATATSYDKSTYSLHEAGGYGGQSWNLSSFNLLQQDQSASTFNSSITDASLSSGGFSENYSWGGVQLYNIGGTFITGGSTTTVVQHSSQSSYSVSEQGTFTNAAFALSGYAFAYAQSSQQTTSATGGSTETIAGADNVGQGASNPTFTGSGTGTVSAQDYQSSNSNLSQQGSFAGGSFNLTAVTYAGAASDSYSASDASASAWTGGFSGSATNASADSGSNAQNVSASGSFSGGSWSLSSYVLSGSAQLADSKSSSWQESVSLGTLGNSSGSMASSDASAGSSSLYQAGTQQAGTYTNTSYNYHDGSASTATANEQGLAQGPGLAAVNTWTQQSASTIVLNGGPGVRNRFPQRNRFLARSWHLAQSQDSMRRNPRRTR